jgi:hypothetical protein
MLTVRFPALLAVPWKSLDALDEKWTKTTPKVGPNGSGFFSQRKAAARSITIDDFSADYLMIKAMATHTTPAEIIRENGTGTNRRFFVKHTWRWAKCS